MTDTVEAGKPMRGSHVSKLVFAFLVVAIGYFLWRLLGEYSNNIYFQSSPSTGILADFYLLASLVLIIGLSLTLVIAKARRTVC